MSEHDAAMFFEKQMQPFLMHLYSEAGIGIPENFDFTIESARIVVALREQGYASHFKTKLGREVK